MIRSLRDSELFGRVLAGAYLRGANLSGVDWRDVDLREADLIYTDFTRANLSGANMSRVDLTNANLTGSNLSGANLGGATLRYATLTRVNLQGANLCEVELSARTLYGVNLSEAELIGLTIDEKKVCQVCAVAWSPDNKYLASGGWDGFLRIWDTETWKQAVLLDGKVRCIWSIDWNADGTLIVCADGDGMSMIWDARTWKKIWSNWGLFGLAFANNCHSLCTGRDLWNITITDREPDRFQFELRAKVDELKDIPNSVCYTPSDLQVAIGCYGGDILLCRADSGKIVRRISNASNELIKNDLCCDPNGELVVRGSGGGVLKFWNLETGDEVLVLESMCGPIQCVTFSPQGGQIAWIGGLSDGVLVLCNLEAGRYETKSIPVQGGNFSIRFSPDGRLLAQGGTSAIHIWDVDPGSSTFGQCLRILEVKIDCREMHIGNAKGLDATAPDGNGKLRDWLIARGAVE